MAHVGQGVCESPGRTAGLEGHSHRWESHLPVEWVDTLTLAAQSREVGDWRKCFLKLQKTRISLLAILEPGATSVFKSCLKPMNDLIAFCWGLGLPVVSECGCHTV